MLSTFSSSILSAFFFFNDTATTEIYTLSLHDALPIWTARRRPPRSGLSRPPPRRTMPGRVRPRGRGGPRPGMVRGTEEHTFQLQSQREIVCRLLLEKKKK